MTAPATDKQLLQDHLQGNPDAFRTFYDRHAPALWAYLMAMLGDSPNTEDALQEVFRKALAQAQRLATLENCRFYLFKMARHEAVNLYRSLPRNNTIPLQDGWIQSRVAPDDSLADAEETLRVQTILESMAPALREALVLHVFEDLTFQEMAELTGENSNTLQSRFRKGMQLFKAKYQEHNDD